MARVVILGAGISGHTAALHLKRRLKRAHEVIIGRHRLYGSGAPGRRGASDL